jgi:hypothetical protein
MGNIQHGIGCAIILLVMACDAQGAGRIPVAYISATGDGGAGWCVEGSNCWYDSHRTGAQEAVRALKIGGLSVAAIAAMTYLIGFGIKKAYGGNKRSGGMISA